MLIGLPGSGKSTLTRRLLDDEPRQIVVSTDAIRAQLFGDEAIQGPWPQVWQELQRQLTVAIADIQAGNCLGVIYDATNAVRRNRRPVLDLARSLGFSPIVALWLDLPLAVCQMRNQNRDRQVPDAVIEQMYRCLMGAPPEAAEGFDQIHRLTSDDDDARVLGLV